MARESDSLVCALQDVSIGVCMSVFQPKSSSQRAEIRIMSHLHTVKLMLTRNSGLKRQNSREQPKSVKFNCKIYTGCVGVPDI